MTRSAWTPALRQAVLNLWRDGKSASECARFVSSKTGAPMSRSAIMGMVHRAGEMRNSLTDTRQAHGVRTAKQTPAKQKPIIIDTGFRIHPQTPPKPPTPIRCEPADVTDAKPLEDLKRFDCRWPLNSDASQMRFCSRLVVNGKSYCADHLAKSQSGETLRAIRLRDPTIRNVRADRAGFMTVFGIDRRAS